MLRMWSLGYVAIFIVLGFSTPAAALCNDICKAKCKANWSLEFASEKQCLAVWSRRNGPSGRGCGTPGGPFKRCE